MSRAATATVTIAPSAEAAIRAEARRVYPNEGCGALAGPRRGEISHALALPNGEREKPRTRFAVAGADYLAAESWAEALGLTLFGFWHSHPDHPARPSETDRSRAWPGLLTVVVAVDGGRDAELTAWSLPDPDAAFEPVAVANE